MVVIRRPELPDGQFLAGRQCAARCEPKVNAKSDGRLRLPGIASLEDKIVQHAVVTMLMQIYETVFLGISYGFGPGRYGHQALKALWVGLR